MFAVTPQKEDELRQFMARLGIVEGDLEERFVKGSGAGGQKVNKTSSCVWLLHKPTGLEVKCQRERSQAMNRYFARRELCEKLEEKIKGVRSARQQEQEKIRRQKRRRSRRQRERMLDDKRKHADKKSARRWSPGGEG
jgi:protein subunit release factor B